MTTLFLSLDDAVNVACQQFDVDPVLARQAFTQKCYITDDQYIIGYHDGLRDSIEAIESIAAGEKGDPNEKRDQKI